MDGEGGKEISIKAGEAGVENEKIEDIKRRILKVALERITSDSSGLTVEYPDGFNDEGKKQYKGDVLVTSLALSVPGVSPDSHGLAIALLNQTPSNERNRMRRSLGYGISRAEHGLLDGDKEVAVTEMRRAEEKGVDNAVVTRLHFSDIGLDHPGGTINFGVTYKEDAKAKDEKLPNGGKTQSLLQRWKEGRLQAAPTDHMNIRATVFKGYPDEEDYQRILDSLEIGVTDSKLTGKIAKSQAYWSDAKPSSSTSNREGNRILGAIKKRVPLLK